MRQVIHSSISCENTVFRELRNRTFSVYNEIVEKEKIPEESETIAVKRAARLHEKILKGRTALFVNKAWWTAGPLEALAILFLVLLNFYLTLPFFGTAAPTTQFSGPVIPLIARALEFIFKVPLPLGFQIIYLTFFILLPLTSYLFIRKVAERKSIAFLSVMFASLPIYPFALARLNSVVATSDGPHIASLTLIPIALLSLLNFTRHGELKNLLFASVASALVVLTSPFGFFMLLILGTITVFSEMLLGSGRLKLFRLLGIFLVTAGLSSFWYNPQFSLSLVFGPLGEEIRETVTKLIPISFFTLPVLGAFGYLLFDRKPNLQPLFLSFFYTVTFALIVWAGGGFFPSNPSRYVAELGVSFSFLLAIGIVKFLDYVRFLQKTPITFINQLNKKAVANSGLFLISVVLIWVIVAGRSGITTPNVRVLGLWTGVERGRIWVEREKSNVGSSVLGYAVTGVTMTSLTILGRKFGKTAES